MSEGKCEDCGKPTDLRDDGQPWERCLDCGMKAKKAKAKMFEKSSEQAKLPVRSAQELMQDIFVTFKIAMDFMATHYPSMQPELAVRVALDLNNQYWKNDRTPR